MKKIRRLFWDIETSPDICFSWRTGYKITIDHDNILKERAIICICYKWEGEKEVGSLQWDRGDDRELLETFSIIANSADELVAHNGDKFDIKWFNARHVFHSLEPIPIYKTVDTLKMARSRFYFNSNRLDYLGKFLLGEGKIKTDFDLWKKVVRDNDPVAMNDMVRYCKKDVVLLERVWERLAPYCKPTTHSGALTGNGRWSCPHCGGTNVIKSKTTRTRMGMKQHQMYCKDCIRYYTVSNLVFNQYLEARYGEYIEEVA